MNREKRLLIRTIFRCTLVASSLLGCSTSAPGFRATSGTCVTDRRGRIVCVSNGPHRVSCDDILCLESMATLGATSTIVQMRAQQAPWRFVDARVPSIPTFDEPSVEQMLLDRVDIAFVYPDPRALDRYARAGVAALVSQSNARDATTATGFLAAQKDSLRLFASVLGPAAIARASRWAEYADDRVRFVASRTASLPREGRPSAYYVRGPSALTSHGRATCTYWYSQFAGVDLVTDHSDIESRGEVSAEQLIMWDPEVIFVGRLYSPDLVLRDPRFRTLRAVARGAVYRMPGGLFFWDGGPESVLLMLWVAKTLHPDIFPDLDLRATVRDYYATFYGANLDDDNLDNLLAGRPPRSNHGLSRRE